MCNFSSLLYLITHTHTHTYTHAEESRIDPNDPKNIKLLHLLQSVPTTDEGAGNVFVLQQLHDRERLVGDDEFARDRRFALLEHRQQGVLQHSLTNQLHYCIFPLSLALSNVHAHEEKYSWLARLIGLSLHM